MVTGWLGLLGLSVSINIVDTGSTVSSIHIFLGCGFGCINNGLVAREKRCRKMENVVGLIPENVATSMTPT